MRLRLIVSLMLVMALLSGPVFMQSAQAQTYTLRAAHYFPEDFAWHQALEFMDERLQELTDGRARIQIFANGVLGGEDDYVQNMMEGVLDLSIVAPASGAAFAPELEFWGVPFLFADRDHWEAALDGEVGQEMAKIIEEATDLITLGYWGGSARNVLSSKGALEDPSDFRGFRIRVIPSPVQQQIWEAVGALPTVVAYLETYSALQAGMVDGMENESPTVLQMRFYEPAPDIMLTEHDITVRPLFMSGKTFRRLPEDIQEAVLQAAREATVKAREIEYEQNLAANKEMAERYGVRFHEVDKGPFIEATAPVRRAVAEDLGVAHILDKIEELAQQ